MRLMYGALLRTIIRDSERSVPACSSTVHVEHLHEFGVGTIYAAQTISQRRAALRACVYTSFAFHARGFFGF